MPDYFFSHEGEPFELTTSSVGAKLRQYNASDLHFGSEEASGYEQAKYGGEAEPTGDLPGKAPRIEPSTLLKKLLNRALPPDRLHTAFGAYDVPKYEV